MAVTTVVNLGEEIQERAPDILKQAYKDSTGEDIREGSALNTMFIGRMADLLQPSVDKMNIVLGTLNLNTDPQYDLFIDLLSGFYLDERNEGSKATGGCRIGFSARTHVEIPLGTIFFTNEGLLFLAKAAYAFTPSQLSLEGGKYYTPSFTVEAETEGDQYLIKANDIIGTNLIFSGIADVNNLLAFTGGSNRETNDALLSRLLTNISSRTLSNEPGINSVLLKQFPSYVKSLVIIGAGDPEMERDFVYSLTSGSAIPFLTVDYGKKIAGSTAEEPSIAKKAFIENLIPDITDTAGVISVDDFATELLQTEYDKLKSQDSNLMIINTDKIFSETWVRVANTNDVSPWLVGETNGPWSASADYVQVDNVNNLLVIGGSVIDKNISFSERYKGKFAQIFKAEVEKKFTERFTATGKRAIDKAVKANSPGKASVASTDDGSTKAEYSTIDELMAEVIDEVSQAEELLSEQISFNNTSPAIQTAIPDNFGIVIKGNFRLKDDDISKMRPLFITNFRNQADDTSNARADDGYGIAIFPTTNPAINNVMIVDNDALKGAFFVAGTEMWGTGQGEIFLKSVALTLNVDTLYNYELIYNVPNVGESDAVALDVRIWEDGGGRPGSTTISYGAYVPLNKRAENLEGNAQSLTASDFGFGVLQTDGFTWEIGPIDIYEISAVHAAVLFELDLTSHVGENVEILVSHGGEGADGGAGADGSFAKIIGDFDTTPAWQNIEENTTAAPIISRKVFAVDDFIDVNNIMFVMIASSDPFDAIAEINAQVESDYISAFRNYNGLHAGNKTDIYIQKISSSFNPEVETFVDKTAITGRLILNETTGFTRPLTRIISIETLSGGDPTGLFLEENVDWRFISNEPENDGSSKENKMIIFSAFATVFDVRITYKYVANFAEMQAFVDGSTAKPSRSNLLLKHPQIKYIDVSFESDYTGQDLIDAIKSYIYDAIEEVEAFDILTLASQFGATTSTITSMSLTADRYDSDGNKKTEVSSDEITKTRVQIFIPRDITIIAIT